MTSLKIQRYPIAICGEDMPYVVCADGTVWVLKLDPVDSFRWVQLPSIPGTEVLRGEDS